MKKTADGTDRLCRALYGRDAKCADYLGGSQTRMLHDAADMIESIEQFHKELGRQLDEKAAEIERLKDTLRTQRGSAWRSASAPTTAWLAGGAT